MWDIFVTTFVLDIVETFITAVKSTQTNVKIFCILYYVAVYL